ncbi:hypothetical protein [uncultured Rhodoblastus sp.]|uniref:hypothetical protein n=1 Tax=uncultured Rhodoblastus sp. TaxID=543037 RepID=UPI0025F28408|nr:hypothetical protein [uncultured Rhodoblastus sp.]
MAGLVPAIHAKPLLDCAMGCARLPINLADSGFEFGQFDAMSFCLASNFFDTAPRHGRDKPGHDGAEGETNLLNRY